MATTYQISTATDSGTQGDLITRFLQPTLEFAGAPLFSSYSVTIRNLEDGSTRTYVGLVAADGTFSIDTGSIGGDLSEGSWQIDALEYGGVPFPNTLSAFVIDATAPAVTLDLVDDQTGDVIGDVQDGGATDATTLAVSGTFEAGSTLALLVTDEQNNTFIVDPSLIAIEGNNWTATVDLIALFGDVPNGTRYTIEASVTDTAGNNQNVTRTVVLDQTTSVTIDLVTDNAGDVTGDVLNGAATDDAVLTVSGTFENGATLTINVSDGTQIVAVDPADITNPTAIDWTANIDLAALFGEAVSGTTYTITATVTDAAGNSTQMTRSIVLDQTGPALTIDTVTDDAGDVTGDVLNGAATDDINLALAGSVEDGATIAISVSDGTNNVNLDSGTILINGGNWTANADLLALFGDTADGTYTVTVTATDAAGNNTQTTRSFTLDQTNPTVTIGAVTDNAGGVTGDVLDGTVTDDATLALSGTVEAGATVSISVSDGFNSFDVAAQDIAVTGADWTANLDIAALFGLASDTTYTVTVTATDAAGNSTQTIRSFTLDLTVPDAITTYTISDDQGAADLVTNARTQTVSGQADITEAGGRVVVVAPDGTELGNALIEADGSWTLTLTDLADGEYLIRIYDATGNSTTGEGFTISSTVAGDDAASDTITGWNDGTNGDFDELISGNGGNDLLIGDGGDDTILGGEGDDDIFGEDQGQRPVTGNDSLLGGNGNDTIRGGNGADFVSGEGDNDSLIGGPGNDTLDGGAGNDTLRGGAGSDTFIVDSYDDFIADIDNDTVSGDIDTVISDLSISINANILSLDPVAGNTAGITVGGFANQAAFDVIENLVLAGTATGAIGNGLDNVITGNGVDNNIYAGGGNDTVFGGQGLDTLVGELGNDYLNGQDDTDLLYGNGGNDTLMGEGGDDSAVGGGGNDWLEGGIGQDDLRGNNNNDTLLGGDDSDLLTGGFANDLLVGDALADTLSSVGGDDVLLAGSGNDTVYGGGGSDSITGGAGNDWLHGGAGNDWFFNTAGGQRLSGVDTLIGGAGDDTLNLQPLSWGRQVVSFDDIVTVVNGQNVIQGVDQVNNFQGDLIDSSGQVINVGGVRVNGPAQNLADQLDLRGLFNQLGYDPNDAAAAANRQAALDIRPTATTGLFEIWVDADATATVDFQLIARVQLTSGTIDLNENIILV